MSEANGTQQGFEVSVPASSYVENEWAIALLMAKYRSDVDLFLGLPFCQDSCFAERSPAAWENLHSFSLEHLRAMVENFADYVAVCQEVAQICGGEFRNKQAVWTYLKRKQLVPSSSLMSQILESDVIEIFDLRGNQIFRNIQYFKVSSYTFEDLMHFPVNMLYRREAKISALLMEEVGKLLSGQLGSEFASQVPVHEVSEVRSTKLFTSVAEQRILAPLFDSQGNVAAVLATVDIQIKSIGIQQPLMQPEYFL